jgi:hypothetical protein
MCFLSPPFSSSMWLVDEYAANLITSAGQHQREAQGSMAPEKEHHVACVTLWSGANFNFSDKQISKCEQQPSRNIVQSSSSQMHYKHQQRMSYACQNVKNLYSIDGFPTVFIE